MMVFLLLACTEKKVMPKALDRLLIYDVHVEARFLDEQEQRYIEEDWTIAVQKKEVLRDDSLLLSLRFVEAQRRESEAGSWQDSTLRGREVEVTAFPWGEMLRVEGWEHLADVPDINSLDIILPLLFPNPPVRPSQQWTYRILPWKYKGALPEGIYRLNQKISANWTQTDERKWAYSGTWSAASRLQDIFDGTVSGTVETDGAWLQKHQWNWNRELEYPSLRKEEFTGQIQRVENE